MKFLRSNFALVVIVLALITLQACKAKKLPPKPAPVDTTKQVPLPPAPAPQPTPPPPPPPAPKPDYNFTNIQFEFNSSILRTDAYPLLDQAAANMKMDPSVKFALKGYASIEGTPEHNMQLSIDRANSVKTYLVNSGVSADNISANGYGTSDPVADNNTEEGKAKNRRVEISKQ